MFPLRTAFEDRDAVCDAKLDHLVIARLKVQRRMMLERHQRYVPVLDAGTLLGVVSFHDVAKAVYEEQSFENRMLKSYIGASPSEDVQA